MVLLMSHLPLASLTVWTALGAIAFLVLPAIVVLELLRYVFLELRRDRIPIILYHRLVSRAAVEQGLVPDNEMIWVSYDTRFAEQMRYLHAAGFTTLDMDDYLQVRAGRLPIPAKPVIVTFDDGYLSTYTMGFPVLRSLGQKAVVFVAPEPSQVDQEAVKGVDGFLNGEQMRELASHGVSVQSHTLTHCILSELPDGDASRELTESRVRIAEMTGAAVEHIAIPCSGYSRRVWKLTKAAGYKTACCNNKGSSNGWSDPLALPRIVIERDMTVEEFAQALTPRGAVMARVTGNLKRLPERLGGARFAYWVRGLLYREPWRSLFVARNLKRVVGLLAVTYMACCVAFWAYLALG